MRGESEATEARRESIEVMPLAASSERESEHTQTFPSEESVCSQSTRQRTGSTEHPPPSMAQQRPRRLPGLETAASSGGAHYIPDEQKRLLLEKYGDLTRPSLVPRHISNVALARAPLGGGPVGSLERTAALAPRARDDLGEYVLRREMEERLAQMDMRISMLANALRQQDELSQRMQQSLDEVIAKTAALPQPRPARSALSGILMDGGGLLDAGGMVGPDPTGGGLGGGGGNGGGNAFPFNGAPLGLGLGAGPGPHGHHHGLHDEHGEDEGEEEDHLGDDEDDEAENMAGDGLEALAGMEAVNGDTASRGVGEAGMVKVGGRGMKQVRLQLRYTNPIVIACLVPPRPSSALSSPEAQRKFEADLPRAAGTYPYVCVPFKGASSFTVQLLPPSGTDMQVAYVVLEAGPHTLPGLNALLSHPSVQRAIGIFQVSQRDLALVLMGLAMALRDLPHPFTIIESGNLCGGVTMVLALLKKAICPECPFVSADPGWYRVVLGQPLSCAASTLKYGGVAAEVTLVDALTASIVVEHPVGFVYLDDGKVAVGASKRALPAAPGACALLPAAPAEPTCTNTINTQPCRCLATLSQTPVALLQRAPHGVPL